MEYYRILLVVFIKHVSKKAERAFLKPGMFRIYFCILSLVLSGVHWITAWFKPISAFLVLLGLLHKFETQIIPPDCQRVQAEESQGTPVGCICAVKNYTTGTLL
jgi:hypothetical protein